MKEVYIKTFYNLVRAQEQQTGFDMPKPVERYCVYLLAERVEKTNIIPDPSFAEKYLTMFNNPDVNEIKTFADDCLFFTSLLPEYGQRRGLSMRYYADLGITSYHYCSDATNDYVYKQVGDCFYQLQKFLESTIKNRPITDLFSNNL